MSIPALLALLTTPLAFAADPAKGQPQEQRAPLPPVGQIRNLEGQEYSNAVTASDNADLALEAYEAAHRKRPNQPAPPDNPAEFEKVIAAFKQAIERYPGTEIEHYCRLRLAGAYQVHGQFDKTLDEAKKDAERFAGTRLGAEATQTVALTYLQALHDPAQATVWFQKLQAEANRLPEEQELAKWQAAATEGLARCAAERKK
jgi:hypothetical protein